MFAHLLSRRGTSVEKLPIIKLTSNKTEVPQHKWICKQLQRELLNSRGYPGKKWEDGDTLIWKLIYLQWVLKRSSLIQISTSTTLKARYYTAMIKNYCHHVVTISTCRSKHCLQFSTCCFPLALIDQLARQLATKKDQVLAYWWNWGCLNIVLLTKQMRPRSSSNFPAVMWGICVPHPCYGSTHSLGINRLGNMIWSACNKRHQQPDISECTDFQSFWALELKLFNITLLPLSELCTLMLFLTKS